MYWVDTATLEELDGLRESVRAAYSGGARAGSIVTPQLLIASARELDALRADHVLFHRQAVLPETVWPTIRRRCLIP